MSRRCSSARAGRPSAFTRAEGGWRGSAMARASSTRCSPSRCSHAGECPARSHGAPCFDTAPCRRSAPTHPYYGRSCGPPPGRLSSIGSSLPSTTGAPASTARTTTRPIGSRSSSISTPVPMARPSRCGPRTLSMTTTGVTSADGGTTPNSSTSSAITPSCTPAPGHTPRTSAPVSTWPSSRSACPRSSTG